LHWRIHNISASLRYFSNDYLEHLEQAILDSADKHIKKIQITHLSKNGIYTSKKGREFEQTLNDYTQKLTTTTAQNNVDQNSKRELHHAKQI